MKAKYRFGVRWTQKDKEYLQEYWGLQDDRSIARRLNRKVSAVMWMAQEMRLHKDQSFLNASTVARIFSVYVIVPIRWIEMGLLKAKKNGKYWQIDEKDLIAFMRANPSRYDVKRMDAIEYPYLYALARRFTVK